MPETRLDNNHTAAPAKSADEVLAEAEAYGVDLSQLRERLKLTPTERAEQHQKFLRFVLDLREAGAALRR